jgi:N utilization substance protein A
VRITDINRRKMEVIVTEDQLSLAIGKRGQNVRLATRLVGWDIDIKNESELRKEIAQQMGKMMASGEAVPVSALEGVSAAQAEDLKEKGINDVETLAVTSLDDLVDILDISLDDAEAIIAAANAVVDAKNDLSSEDEDAEEIAGDEAVEEAQEGTSENTEASEETENESKEVSTEEDR